METQWFPDEIRRSPSIYLRMLCDTIMELSVSNWAQGGAFRRTVKQPKMASKYLVRRFWAVYAFTTNSVRLFLIVDSLTQHCLAIDFQHLPSLKCGERKESCQNHHKAIGLSVLWFDITFVRRRCSLVWRKHIDEAGGSRRRWHPLLARGTCPTWYGCCWANTTPCRWSWCQAVEFIL